MDREESTVSFASSAVLSVIEGKKMLPFVVLNSAECDAQKSVASSCLKEGAAEQTVQEKISVVEDEKHQD